MMFFHPCYNIKTVSDCGDLTEPGNCTMDLPATTYQSIATFTCDVGYYITGESALICEAGGAWNGSEPSCTLYSE